MLSFSSGFHFKVNLEAFENLFIYRGFFLRIHAYFFSSKLMFIQRKHVLPVSIEFFLVIIEIYFSQTIQNLIRTIQSISYVIKFKLVYFENVFINC